MRWLLRGKGAKPSAGNPATHVPERDDLKGRPVTAEGATGTASAKQADVSLKTDSSTASQAQDAPVDRRVLGETIPKESVFGRKFDLINEFMVLTATLMAIPVGGRVGVLKMMVDCLVDMVKELGPYDQAVRDINGQLAKFITKKLPEIKFPQEGINEIMEYVKANLIPLLP